MNERRIHRLQEQIKHCLAECLLRDLADPQLGMVTITRVELDDEFTQCKAYWSVLGDEAQKAKSQGVLRRARGLCQRAIGKAISTRSVPHLEFVHDVGIAGAIQMNRLLDELRAEREAREQGPQPPVPPSAPPPTTPEA